LRSGDLSASTTPIYNPFSGDTADCVPGGNAKLCGTGRTQFVASSSPGVPTVQGPNGLVDAFNPACTNAAGCPNIIPSALINSISAKLMGLLPSPNVAGNKSNTNNYFALLPFHKDTDFVDGK